MKIIWFYVIRVLLVCCQNIGAGLTATVNGKNTGNGNIGVSANVRAPAGLSTIPTVPTSFGVTPPTAIINPSIDIPTAAPFNFSAFVLPTFQPLNLSNPFNFTLPTFAPLNLSNLPTYPTVAPFNFSTFTLPTFQPFNLSNLPTYAPFNFSMFAFPALNLSNSPTVTSFNWSNLPTYPTFAPFNLSNLPTYPTAAPFNFSMLALPTFQPFNLSNLPTYPTYAPFNLSNLPTYPTAAPFNFSMLALPTFQPFNLSNLPTYPTYAPFNLSNLPTYPTAAPFNFSMLALPTFQPFNLSNLPTYPTVAPFNLSNLPTYPTYAPFNFSMLGLPSLNLSNIPTAAPFNFSFPTFATFAPFNLSNLPTYPTAAPFNFSAFQLPTFQPFNLSNLPTYPTYAPFNLSNLPTFATLPPFNFSLPGLPTFAPMNVSQVTVTPISLSANGSASLRSQRPSLDVVRSNFSALDALFGGSELSMSGSVSGNVTLPLETETNISLLFGNATLPELDFANGTGTILSSAGTNSTCGSITCEPTEVCAKPLDVDPICVPRVQGKRYCSDKPCRHGMNCYDNTTSSIYTCYSGKLNTNAGECRKVKCSLGNVCYQDDGMKPSCISRKQAPSCPEQNEEYQSCSSGCDATCKDPTPNCQNSTTCNPGCGCVHGYVKIDGKCELMDLCDSVSIGEMTCDGTEEYVECMPDCERTCKGSYKKCPKISKMCTPGCSCRPGYHRDDNGQCVHVRSCHSSTTCPTNEHWSQCHNCEKSCGVETNPACSECWSGCGCIDGFSRNADGKCVETC